MDPPNGGIECGGVKKLWFFDQYLAFYLGNFTRYDHSYLDANKKPHF